MSDAERVGCTAQLSDFSFSFRLAEVRGKEYLAGMKAKQFIWLIAVMAVCAFAQPQAPISWGEARWMEFYNAPHPTNINNLIPLGDTLIFAGRIDTSTGAYPAAAYSHDNGLTHSAIMPLGSILSPGINVNVTASSSVALVAWDGTWVRRSTNAGLTWGNSVQFNDGVIGIFVCDQRAVLTGLQAINDSVFNCRIRLSDDYGATWRVNNFQEPFFFWQPDKGITFTRSHLLIVGSKQYYEANRNNRIRLLTKSRNEPTWDDFRILPGQPLGYCPDYYSVVGDTTSETACVCSVWRDYSGDYPNTTWIIRTTDGGATWETPCLLPGDVRMLWTVYPQIFCRGKFWGVALGGIQWGGILSEGTFVWLSANHGKSWYPPQQIDTLGVSIATGQFVNREMRIYWERTHFPAGPGDFRTITGILTPDTFLPAVTPVTLAPDTIPASDSILFRAVATDNDTLAEVRVNLIYDMDTIRVSMAHDTGAYYSIRWTPTHEGNYRYWFSAEDFWENQAIYPDTGSYQFYARGLKASENILHPSSFSLSCFPNPFNSTATLKFSLPSFANSVELAVYDVLGREVLRKELHPAAQSFEYRLNASGWGSGVYIVFARAGQNVARQKLMLLR
jgi:hypothetical protein